MDFKIHVVYIATLFFGVAYSNPPFHGNIEKECEDSEEGITKVPAEFGNHKGNIGHGAQGELETGIRGGSYRILGFERGSVAEFGDSKGRALGIGSTVGQGSDEEFESEPVETVGDESGQGFGTGLGTEFKSGENYGISKSEQLRDTVKIGIGNEFGIEERFGGGTADFSTSRSGDAKDADLLSQSEIENIREVFGGGPTIGVAREDGGLESGYGGVGGFKGKQGLTTNKEINLGHDFGGGPQDGGFSTGQGHNIKQGFGSGQSTWFRGDEGYDFGGGYGDAERYRNKYVGPIGIGKQDGIGFEEGCREDEETGAGKGIHPYIKDGAEFAGGVSAFQDEQDERIGTGPKFRFGQSAYFEDDEDDSFEGKYKGRKYGSLEVVGPIGGKQKGGFGTVQGQGPGSGTGSFAGSGGRRFTDIFRERESGLRGEFGRGEGGGFGQGRTKGFGVTQGRGFETDGYKIW